MTQKRKSRKKPSMEGSLTLRMPYDMLKFFEVLADKEGEAVSTIARRALRDYARANGFVPEALSVPEEDADPLGE